MTDAVNEKAEARALTPDIAWPTLAYGLLVISAHWTMVWLGLSGRVSIWALTLPLGFTAYAHYTLVHEAVHRNMFAKRFKLDWLQDAIGWVGSVMIFANWPMLNRTHKHHHSHVNTDKDPDIFVKGRLARLLIRNVVRGVLQLIPMVMLKGVFRDRSFAMGYLNADLLMSPSEKAQHFIANAVMAVALWIGVALGYGVEVFALYYIPAHIGGQLLSVLFQWLPHHPFEETSRYRATRNTGRTGLNLPFIWQNWHLMHHLWPAVPFYNYEQLYRRIRPALEEKGARHHEGVTPKAGPSGPPFAAPAA